MALEALTQLLQSRYGVGREDRRTVAGEVGNLLLTVDLLKLTQRGERLTDERVLGRDQRRVATLQVHGQLPSIRQLQRAQQDPAHSTIGRLCRSRRN